MSNPKSLAGVKVVDFTRVFAGPFCSMLLADLGADVVKIELPGAGDPMRSQGPPFHHGMGVTFLSTNRNKRSIAVDLSLPDGKDIARRLAMKADVLVENFRPDVMPRLGLGYEQLRQANPGLVYAAISGLGADGPDSHVGVFDLTAQAIGGYMSLTGERDGRPIKLGTSAFDMLAGLNCFAAVLAALLQRKDTNQGQKVETSLLEAQVALLANAGLEHLLTGAIPGKWGSEHPQMVPYKAFRTADGWAVIGAAYQNMWEAFLKVIGRTELQEDPRFCTLEMRIRNRDALHAILDPEVEKFGTKDLLARLDAAKVPCAPVNDMSDVFSHRQVRHRGMVRAVTHPAYGELPQIGPAAKYSAFDVAEGWTAPPMVGEHTDLVLRDWLDMSDADLSALHEKGAIA